MVTKSTIPFWDFVTKQVFIHEFLGGYNFHGNLDMKVESQTRNINTFQCQENKNQ
jgi:hypothetical protein